MININDCLLSPKGVQSYCRNEKVWLNRIVLEYDKSMYKANLGLYTSYRSRKPKTILVRCFENKEDLKSFVIEIWSLYPRLDIANNHILY